MKHGSPTLFMRLSMLVHCLSVLAVFAVVADARAFGASAAKKPNLNVGVFGPSSPTKIDVDFVEGKINSLDVFSLTLEKVSAMFGPPSGTVGASAAIYHDLGLQFIFASPDKDPRKKCRALNVYLTRTNLSSGATRTVRPFSGHLNNGVSGRWKAKQALAEFVQLNPIDGNDDKDRIEKAKQLSENARRQALSSIRLASHGHLVALRYDPETTLLNHVLIYLPQESATNAVSKTAASESFVANTPNPTIGVASSVPGDVAASVIEVGKEPSSFEDAEAWNLDLGAEIIISTNVVGAIFNHDASKLIYVTSVFVATRPARNSFEPPKGYNTNKLVFYDLEKRAAFQMIILPSPAGCLASAPDDKRVVCVGGRAIGSGIEMLFADIESSKVIPVPIDAPQFMTVSWPKSNVLFLHARESTSQLNLDTLKVSDVSRAEHYAAINGNDGRMSHKNCEIKIEMNHWVPNSGRFDFVINSRTKPFSKILKHNVLDPDQDRGFWKWTPNLRYLIRLDGGDNRLTLTPLVVRKTPQIEFPILGLESTLTADALSRLQNAFKAQKNTQMAIFGKKTNPLNEKVVGPNREDYKANGKIVVKEGKFWFRLINDLDPITDGDVVASLPNGTEFYLQDAWGMISAKKGGTP
ncbi:MAG: hypothetical protein HY301_18220 [Verrucomicrobia bacterium]|nr:hypothetical protein [Verrucomicrobiota bacterium]